MSLYVLGFWAGLVVTCSLAFWSGERLEQRMAIALLAAALATLIVRSPWSARYDRLEWGVALVDVGLAAALVTIAIRSKPLWPTIPAALQIIAVLAHIAKAQKPGLWHRAYQLMASATSYVIVLTLLGAVLVQLQRRQIAARRLRSN